MRGSILVVAALIACAVAQQCTFSNSAPFKWVGTFSTDNAATGVSISIGSVTTAPLSLTFSAFDAANGVVWGIANTIEGTFNIAGTVDTSGTQILGLTNINLGYRIRALSPDCLLVIYQGKHEGAVSYTYVGTAVVTRAGSNATCTATSFQEVVTGKYVGPFRSTTTKLLDFTLDGNMELEITTQNVQYGIVWGTVGANTPIFQVGGGDGTFTFVGAVYFSSASDGLLYLELQSTYTNIFGRALVEYQDKGCLRYHYTSSGESTFGGVALIALLESSSIADNPNSQFNCPVQDNIAFPQLASEWDGNTNVGIVGAPNLVQANTIAQFEFLGQSNGLVWARYAQYADSTPEYPVGHYFVGTIARNNYIFAVEQVDCSLLSVDGNCQPAAGYVDARLLDSQCLAWNTIEGSAAQQTVYRVILTPPVTITVSYSTSSSSPSSPSPSGHTPSGPTPSSPSGHTPSGPTPSDSFSGSTLLSFNVMIILASIVIAILF